jgi:hypothetical protein
MAYGMGQSLLIAGGSRFWVSVLHRWVFAQHFHVTALSFRPYRCQCLDHLLMQPAITGNNLGTADIEYRAIHVADVTAGFLDQQ